MLESVEMDLLMNENQTMLKDLAKSTAPIAILVGTLIDNVPESVIIGMNTAETTTLSWSFLLAVFISNFPEALSSATGMKQAGTRPGQILALWLGVVVLSGICATAGGFLASSTPQLILALAQAISGGAILAMLASTMMPEAYELGGGSVAFSTILGFLTAFFISSVFAG